MKIKSLFVACFIALVNVCFGQNSPQITSVNFENMIKPVIPSTKTVLADMKANSPEMFSQYQSAKKMQKTGIVFTSISGGFLMIGTVLSLIPDSDSGTLTMGFYIIETEGDHAALRTAGNVMAVAGAIGLSVSIPVMIVGGNRKKQTFRNFRSQHYLSHQSSPYLQMNVYPNRVGIAYVF